MHVIFHLTTLCGHFKNEKIGAEEDVFKAIQLKGQTWDSWLDISNMHHSTLQL